MALRATRHLSVATPILLKTIKSHVFILGSAILRASSLHENNNGQQHELYPVTYHAFFLCSRTDRTKRLPRLYVNHAHEMVPAPIYQQTKRYSSPEDHGVYETG